MSWKGTLREMSEPHDFDPNDFQAGAFAVGAQYLGVLTEKGGWKGNMNSLSRMAEAYSWSLLDEPWDSQGTWIKVGDGIVWITDGYLLLWSQPGPVALYKVLDGGLPTQYTIEVQRLLTDDVWSDLNVDDGEHFVAIRLDRENYRFGVMNNAGSYVWITAPEYIEETFTYTWRFVVDSEGHSIKAYWSWLGLPFTYIGEWTDIRHTQESDGFVWVGVANTAQTTQEYDLKIAPGLHPPPDISPELVKLNSVLTEKGVWKGTLESISTEMILWDIMSEEWSSLGTWGVSENITSIISPPGQLYQAPGAAYGGFRYKTLGGGLPSKYTVEFRVKVDDWDDDGTQFRSMADGEHLVKFQMWPGMIGVMNSSGSYNTINLATGGWHIWHLLVDSANENVKVYRDFEYIGEFTSLKDDVTSDGYVSTGFATGAKYHEDYWRIHTGLQVPFRGKLRGVLSEK
ncbi:MAG: hypothetical protein AM326_03035 [Candidatus Thorarchaeota archaeon SMTZ-45]|nr:MAG: hypothetical protein AM326_03035 [Candidatus Thorarchaeota archaeon SMTZ-45]